MTIFSGLKFSFNLIKIFMHKSLQNVRFSIKPQTEKGNRPVELARTMSIHPLTYQELPFDPEYSHYAGRLTTEKL